MGIIRGSRGYQTNNNRDIIGGHRGIQKDHRGIVGGSKGVSKKYHRDIKRDTGVSYGGQIGNIGGSQGYHTGITGLTLRDRKAYGYHKGKQGYHKVTHGYHRGIKVESKG